MRKNKDSIGTHFIYTGDSKHIGEIALHNYGKYDSFYIFNTILNNIFKINFSIQIETFF